MLKYNKIIKEVKIKMVDKLTLKAARVNAGLTQEELAKKANVSRNTVSTWENEPSSMKIKDAELVCTILNVPINYIFFK